MLLQREHARRPSLGARPSGEPRAPRAHRIHRCSRIGHRQDNLCRKAPAALDLARRARRRRQERCARHCSERRGEGQRTLPRGGRVERRRRRACGLLALRAHAGEALAGSGRRTHDGRRPRPHRDAIARRISRLVALARAGRAAARRARRGALLFVSRAAGGRNLAA